MRNNTIGYFQSHNLINTITVIMIVEFPSIPIGIRNDHRARVKDGRNTHVK
ncbi:MAG: hypothetical protein WAM42_17220 [Candidatus Nitrosopolaris sp.]